MRSLKAAKASLLAMSRNLGLFSAVGRSRMRRNRLLIICYHGISSGDECQCNPWMFMPTKTFERRMEILKDCGAKVLDLGEALPLLYEGRLPPRSIVLTFDDGWGDFRANAFPIVQRYGFPATVYLTSYYCLFNKPVVPVVVEYLLWKCRGEVFENSDLPFLPRKIDLRSEENRRATLLQLDGYAKRRALSGKERDDLVAEIADLLQIDYESLLYERRFHIMKPEEVTEISRGGIDVQLHTHSHRILLNRDEFVEDIKQNQRHVEELTGKDGRVHFCYPGGIHRPEFLPWLGEAGIQSATTCVPAFSRKTGNSLLLPRLLDRPSLSEIEFEGWVAGFGVTMPRLKLPPRDVASPPQVTTVRG